MESTVKIEWNKREEEIFVNNRYSRKHTWHFDGGAIVAASSSPAVVPLPMSDPTAVDPEEAFTASISSCHMLWFLSLAAAQKWIVSTYRDTVTGTLSTDENGRQAMTDVTLRPQVIFQGNIPTKEQLDNLHHQAHDKCFIANSVKTRITVIPQD